MAANNAANVSAGKPKIGGAIFRAPKGTALPSTAVAQLNEAFINLGFVSEDGVKNANSPESQVIKEWGGGVVLTTQNGKEDKFSFTLIESLNPEVLKVVFGDQNVSGTLATGISVTSNDDAQEGHAYVIDMEMKGGYIRRICIPDATVSEVGEISYKSAEAIGYAITLQAAKDSSGNSHYEYIQEKPNAT